VPYKRLRRSAVSRGRSSSAAATLRVKTHFNVQHMVAAALFARKVFEIEATRDHRKGLVSDESYFAHTGYVAGAVFSAVASLEATINELFIGAQHGDPHTFKGADPEFPPLLAQMWGVISQNPSTLAKYQTALVLAKKPKFDRGASPYWEAVDLIQLRNALIHYKPEWSTDQREHRKIERRLNGQFALNPFAGPNDAFFPKKCLGHGCAEWAVQSGVSFIKQFFDRLGLATIFAGERQDREEIQQLLRTR
jgi:hypothetical protein